MGLDAPILAHLRRMPETTWELLGSKIATDAADPWVRSALMAYLRHFTRLFELHEDRLASESALADDLAQVIGDGRIGTADEDMVRFEAKLQQGFRDRGHHFLGGRTPPHYGAYVWLRSETRRFTVTLPGSEPIEVDVHFMHDFLIRGWLHWKTLGAQGAGGWYKQDDPEWSDGLYCVADRYEEPIETNPKFVVSLLGHEAQHVADERAFPGMSSVELEYRAKLVELIGYASVADRLRFFIDDAADDPESPHPYAAHLIVDRLARRIVHAPSVDPDWEAVPYDRIRDEARAMLDEDTAARA